MAYNNGREDRKWRIWKEAEEKVLREHGVDETTNQTHSSENGYANASNAGVSWYADLKGYIGVQPTKLYGSGTFKLAPKSTTTSGSTTLYGHYVHPKAELGLSVNVSSYGSFSISGGSNYDERGSQKTISW